MLVDIHSHLDSRKFEKDLNEVIKRLKQENIIVINNGLNLNSNKKILEMSKKFPFLKSAFGVYPVDIDSNIDKEIEWIEENLEKAVAIGEVGLDYYWVKDEKKQQIQQLIFKKFITLSKKYKKPIIVHSRKAESDAIEILEKEKAEKVVLHCFNGNLKLIKKAENLGYYFSIPPIIIKSQHFQKLVESVDLNKLLTETDSPYLSPIPNKKNIPINVKFSIEKIAEIKNLDFKEAENRIYENYKKLFKTK